jgi:phosphohistidine phosphatase
MNLFFLRHGKAMPRGAKWRPDSRRPLSREGETSMGAIARGIRELDISFDVILASPYARALRTAEILAEIMQSPKLFETARLTPEAAGGGIMEEINENFSRAKGIVLVGHEPSMSRLISMLVTGKDDMAMELKKAGLCKLTVEKPAYGKCATLNWLLTPKQLAALGK